MPNATVETPGPARAAPAPGSAHVVTSRVGGLLSTTAPSTSAMPEPSVRRCSQREPGCQSETLLCPQWAAVSSGSVRACQTRSGVLSTYVT